ncbi:MAG: transcription factor [Lysobacterales bacterium 66-474]|nr:MAG: transcription factor [Rhodanobacter sp. SCN 66-43]OJY83429.1 MAG: transcription factor [Xanthomonadales bacterium 66-474]
MPPSRFLRDYWQKRPLLIRGAFQDFTPPLSPDDLAGLACMDGALARIVRHDAKRNHWAVASGPFDDATFAKLPASHWTLLVQDVDKWDADTAALLDAFAFIPSWRIDDVMISYAADRGGVGAHVDQYDVFLLQGMGKRRWAIDAGSNPPTDPREDVELKLLKRFSPTHEWVLQPGDMLYLPPGVPHDGTAVGECMTFSIGMRAPAAGELLFDFAAHVAESLPEAQRFADPDLAPAASAGEIDAAALRRARRALGPVAATLDEDAFADWFGRFITRYRVAQPAAPRRRPIDRDALAGRLPRSRLERDPWSRFAWRRRGRDARLYVAGSVFDAPIAWARELASGARIFEGSRFAKLPGRAQGVGLLATLIDAGYVTLRRR